MGLTKLINLNSNQLQNINKSKPKLTNFETCEQKHEIN